MKTKEESMKELYTLIGKAYNNNFSKEELLDLALNNKEIAEPLASYEKTPPEILDIYSTSQNWRVRCHVALNPNTSTETLLKMREVETDLLNKTAIIQNLDMRDL